MASATERKQKTPNRRRLKQAGAQVKPGDTARFEIERDDEPWKVEVPAILKWAFGKNRQAKKAFEKLSHEAQRVRGLDKLCETT